MAFRFPGDLAAERDFWRSLRRGADLVGRIGPERWATEVLQHPKRSEAGRSVTFAAGVLSRIDEFDAGFFGISPREAAWLDPQQRLLLELTWEAMEAAGQVPSSLARSDCAVYVGISGVDYGMRALDDFSSMTSHSMTGNTLSIAANRLSYVFDLRGPSVAVDTACSSSLVALHQACNSLRSGEASAALVGGVNLLLHPYPFIGFTKASMLSASGRCRAFDAAADGYVRAEGGAVVLLKPLERALADGDPIQAVIAATGTNTDGGRKSGITIPSGAGQAELMREVLARSGLAAEDVDYIEAHGTGTAVGDPIEAAAIGAVYGSARGPGKRLPIGSVKTNLGHLESASGMAGLVKAILVLKNRALPPSLHFVTPNPHIDFAGLNLEVVTRYRPLPPSGRRALAVGVNSFGFGGANAHVLLQQYRPRRAASRRHKPRDPPLFLSARTPQALRALAGRYAQQISRTPAAYYDIAYAAACRRERLERRLALSGGTAADAIRQLADFSKGNSEAQLVLEDALAQPGKLAFVYSGNGAQWHGMGQRLMAESPRFAALIAELDELIAPLADFSIHAELCAEPQQSRLEDTTVAQPLLFAIQVALTTLLRERGIEADAVAGHSAGEVAAVWACGALSLAQATLLICARSAAQGATRGGGRMAAVGLGEPAARELLGAEQLTALEVSGVNSPGNVTLSGKLAALDRLKAILAQRNVFYRLLEFDYAFHSRAMEPIEGDLLARLETLAPVASNGSAFISSVTGAALPGSALDARYWWRNVREPVRFAGAMSALVDCGCRVFIEIGPNAILQRFMTECLSAGSAGSRVLPTMRRGADGSAGIEEAALRAQLLMETPRLESYFPVPARPVRLPAYPWQRERHWHPHSSEASDLITRTRVHPLLGWRLKEAIAAWGNDLDPQSLPWLADHKIGDAIVLPGAAFAELALAASREYYGGARHEFEELNILVPVVFDGEHARSTRFELSVRDGSFQILSRQRLSGDEWTRNAVGRLRVASGGVDPVSAIADVRAARDAVAIDPATHYQLTGALGLQYGPSFRGLTGARMHGQNLSGGVALPAALAAGAKPYMIHPALLDVCFQSLVDFFRDDIEAQRGVPVLPVKIGHLRCYSDAPVVRFRANIKRRAERSVLADFELFDADDCIVATLSDCRFRAMPPRRSDQASPACWTIVPQLQPLAAEAQRSELPHAGALAERLRAWFEREEPELLRHAYFKSALPLFEALTVAFARDAFQELLTDHGDWAQQALAQPERVEEASRPLFRWLAQLLRAERLLTQQPDGSWHLESTDLPAAQGIWRTLLRDHPANLPELVFTARVGRRLAALLRGQGGAAALAAQLRQSHQAEPLLHDSASYLGTRLAVEQIVGGVAAQWPSHRRLRVLDISAATSHTLQQMLESFPAERLDYVIAHPDELVRSRLRTEFAAHLAVQVASLDADSLELSAEARLPGCFDLIIVRHWLHRAAHPVGVLAAARRKLAPGGLLVVAERHPDLVADFVAGLDPNWWRQGAAGEPLSRLRPPAAWQAALAQQNFVEIEAFREPAGADLSEGAYVLLAKRAADDIIKMPEPRAASWLLVCAGPGVSLPLGERLQRLLESRGQRVSLVSPGAAPEAVLSAVRTALGRIDHLVYLASVAESGPPTDGEEPAGALQWVQAIGRDPALPRLWLVTQGQGALWGFGRVVANEYPTLDCTLIDLQIDPASDAAAARLQLELLYPDGEQEILLGAHGRYVARVQNATPAAPAALADPASRFLLDFHAPGRMSNLLWRPQVERALDEDEIEVRVAATGLNFRDVMYLQGLLPEDALEGGFAGASLGLEFAGVVSRVGRPGGEFVVGEAVMGFGPGCFASHVITRTNAIAHKPADWSFESAATVPTVFFTAYYALKQLANLQAGERILIHGGAGGVGIAAIQFALHLGAEVFATAGSDDKRDFVALLGADHVLDSRSVAFADQIMAMTDGVGVDVVLNSLAGEALRRSLDVLRPFGRFIELGKRDFFENTPVGLRPFRNNISYYGIDADQLLNARPALAARLFREVMALFREKVLFPLPYRLFPAASVVEAFRTMQQSHHIGKVVVAIAGARVALEAAPTTAKPVRFEKRARWLVTGGIAGFGLESARWLAARGVGHLVLVGRRGRRTPGAAEAVRSLEALGASVTVMACDIGDRNAVRSMLDEIRTASVPLTGVLHAAAVLDDALIGDLDRQRLRSVVAPKMLGAWHLHEQTLDIPIEHFVLYSSIATLMGNPGQASYVAANAALESLAHMRRGLGLPVTCVGWGPIGDAGMLERNQILKDNVTARLGAAPMSATAALAMLDQLLPRSADTVAVGDFDWPTVARLMPAAKTARFERLRRRAGPGAQDGAAHDDIRVLIARKMRAEALQIVQALVVQEVVEVLCVSGDQIDPRRSVHELGMDSLMAVELVMALEKRFALELPAMLLSEGVTVERVAARIVDKLLRADAEGKSAGGDRLDDIAATLAAQHGETVDPQFMTQTLEQVRSTR
jgi:phthiocerol/phenolphthiocerol synthesis type-I polyketide synthase C